MDKVWLLLVTNLYFTPASVSRFRQLTIIIFKTIVGFEPTLSSLLIVFGVDSGV